MEFLELRQAVSEAFWHKDYTKCDELIDTFLAEAQGEAFGRALTLQASLISAAQPNLAAHGFALITEALPLVRNSPGARMDALMTVLGLCYTASDVERAREYEEDAYRLLLEHTSDPEVRSRRHRLQMGMGQVAYLRGDYTSAYWHFAQAAQSLTSPSVSDVERRAWDYVTQLHVAMACLRVRRYYEAQEALDLAYQASVDDLRHLRVNVWRAELLRQIGGVAEAQQMLDELTLPLSQPGNTDLRVRYFWVSALVAQDAGDLPRYHRFMHLALQEAADQNHDYLLSEIQRFQRLPL